MESNVSRHQELSHVLPKYHYYLSELNETIQISKVKKKAVLEIVVFTVCASLLFLISYSASTMGADPSKQFFGTLLFIVLGILVLLGPIWTTLFKGFDTITIFQEQGSFMMEKSSLLGYKVRKRYNIDDIQNIEIENVSLNTDANAFDEGSKVYIKNIVLKFKNKKKLRLFNFESRDVENLRFVDDFHDYLKSSLK